MPYFIHQLRRHGRYTSDQSQVAAKTPFRALVRAAVGANWLAAPSRFAAWSRPAATFALLLLALIELLGFLTPPVPMNARSPSEAAARVAASGPLETRDDDLVLYDRIIAGLRDGESYYSVAARELRQGGYPLRPFVAFRPPLLAELLAHMSPLAGLLLLRALVVATMLAWAPRLRAATSSPAAWTIACLLLASGVALFGQTRYMVLHEIWAGLLVALSLALRTPRRWLAAAMIGLLALLMRELALPYVVVMAAMALYERKRLEAAGWTGAIVLFAIATGFHAVAAGSAATALDRASPGWAYHGGWSFFLTATWLTGVLKSAPYVAVAALTPLALLGWAGWRQPIAARAFSTFIAYAGMLMLFGRPDNFYWALMFTPLLLVGLTFAPRSLDELICGLRRRTGVKRETASLSR